MAFGAKHTDPLIEEACGEAGLGGARAGRRPRPHAPRLVDGLAGVPRPGRGRARNDAASWRFAAWYGEPALVALLAARVRAAPARRWRAAPASIFTAHSLPERIRQTGDTYPEQVAESARLVAEMAGLDEWTVAWQSAGRTPEAWLGPDVRDVVRRLAAEGSVDAVVVCPIGFVADHLEVLYDLDVELAGVAAACGLRLRPHRIAQRRPRLHLRAADVIIAADDAI